MSSIVSLKDGKPVTTSRIVAESFGKEHRNVLRDIDNIIANPAYQERGLLNFEQTPYIDPQNGQTYRVYEMDRQGFEILAMGFTGEEALRWKFKYSDAFAAMETELKKPSIDPIAAQLAELLQGKVLVDYEALCRLARMTRAGLEKIAAGEKLLEEAEQIGLDLERQCGKPLIKFDIPAERLARHRATPPESRSKRPTSPPDLWEPQVRAFVADRQEVTTTLVLDYLAIPSTDQTQVSKNRVARILRNMGFVSYVVKRGGRTYRIWQRHH